MPAIAIHVVANLVQHRRRREPFRILRRKPVQRFQSPEQMHGRFPDLQGMIHVHAVMRDGGADRILAL